MDESLSAKKTIAACLIAAGMTHKEAAEKVNVTPQTISTWMHDPAFKARIDNLKMKALLKAQDKMRGLAATAIDTIESIVKDSSSDKARLDAAKYILETIKINPSGNAGLWLIGTIND